MKGGLGNLMKQAQKMQENLQKAQAEIASLVSEKMMMAMARRQPGGRR